MNCLKCASGTCVTDTSEKACDLANSLPSLSIASSSNIPHLNDFDADLNGNRSRRPQVNSPTG